MTFRTVSLALIAALALPGAASAADYTIDTKGAHAAIGFRIKHLGFSWLSGRFDTFSGTFSYDEKAPEASKVSVEIDAASVNSNHAERDKHLRNADFLDVEKFPTLTFVSTGITPLGGNEYEVAGDFTIRDVTRRITLPVTFLGKAADPWGNERIAFEAEYTLNRKDYGLEWNRVVEGGGTLVGDDVTIEITVAAVQKTD